MIASLPMYLFPETRAAHDAFWSLVERHLASAGLAAPEALAHDRPPHAVWGDPGLVLSHICNLPYRLRFRDRLTRIAASDYGLDGCDPGFYRALFVVREDDAARSPEDLDGRTMAYNEAESNSGWGAAALWALARGARFVPVLETGSHEASLAAVAEGLADFATVDARSFQILAAHRPLTARLRVLGATDPSPGMTFVTRAGEDPAPYRAALAAALDALPSPHRAALGLRGFADLPDAAYDIPLPPPPEAWRA